MSVVQIPKAYWKQLGITGRGAVKAVAVETNGTLSYEKRHDNPDPVLRQKVLFIDNFPSPDGFQKISVIHTEEGNPIPLGKAGTIEVDSGHLTILILHQTSQGWWTSSNAYHLWDLGNGMYTVEYEDSPGSRDDSKRRDVVLTLTGIHKEMNSQ